MSPAKYRLGLDYPREGFVQRAIDRHFAAAGYHTMDGGSSDLACMHPQTGHKWVVEAKGETADVGLDFRTGLGQLLQAMLEPAATYGLAVPETGKFLAQCEKVPLHVRRALNPHWLLVNESGAVRVVGPNDRLPRLSGRGDR